MNTEEKIEQLRHSKFLLKGKLKRRVAKNDFSRNAYAIFKQYKKCDEKLKQLGFTGTCSAEYLQESYWQHAMNSHQVYDKEINKQPTNSYYIFNLNWSELKLNQTSKDEMHKLVDLLKTYCKSVGVEEVNQFVEHNMYHNDTTIVYEKVYNNINDDTIDTDVKNILHAATFMIDNFTQDAMVKSNIAICGVQKTNNKYIKNEK